MRVREQRARPRLSLTLSVTAGSGKEGERAKMETQVHGVWLDAVTGGRRGPNPPHPKAAIYHRLTTRNMSTSDLLLVTLAELVVNPRPFRLEGLKP